MITGRSLTTSIKIIRVISVVISAAVFLHNKPCLLKCAGVLLFSILFSFNLIYSFKNESNKKINNPLSRLLFPFTRKINKENASFFSISYTYQECFLFFFFYFFQFISCNQREFVHHTIILHIL